MVRDVLTAVDSSVLFDVLGNHADYRDRSERFLRAALSDGALVVCPVVWAEVRAFFDRTDIMNHLFLEAGIRFDPFDRECADVAGALWGEYRRNGGSRKRILSDFLIGAHALVRGATLLTRDRGFYREYFTGLRLFDAKTP